MYGDTHYHHASDLQGVASDSHRHDAREVGAAEDGHGHEVGDIRFAASQGDLEKLETRVRDLELRHEAMQIVLEAEVEAARCLSELDRGVLTVAGLAKVLRERGDALVRKDRMSPDRSGTKTLVGQSLIGVAEEIEKL